MTIHRETELVPFVYSVVRVVPDPIKDEAINIDVAVVGADGAGARLEVDVSAKARSGIRAVQRDFSFQALEWSLRDLEATLGADRQLALGEDAGPPATARVLEETARRLNNQLQLTLPRRYAARTLDEATERLFRRYVSHRRPRARWPSSRPTRARSPW